MFRIHSRFDTGALCEWHECQGCDSPIKAGEYESARTWLRGFLIDDAQAMDLRHRAHGTGDGLGLGTRNGEGVVEELARKIGSGWLRVCSLQSTVKQDQAMQTEIGQPTSPPPPPPPVNRSRATTVAAPPPEPTTMPSNLDAVAMAKVLTAAAESGVPFCEICEKNKRARQTAEATA